MAVTYMTHPEHGATVCYNEIEVAECKKHGWVEQGQVAPAHAAPAEVVAASVAASPEKRGRGRPRKAR